MVVSAGTVETGPISSDRAWRTGRRRGRRVDHADEFQRDRQGRHGDPRAGQLQRAWRPTGTTGDGSPAAFSLWVFVFFNPEECAAAVCGPGDLMTNPDVVAGAFNAGGHIEGGAKLTLAGSVNASRATFGGANAETIGQGHGHGLQPGRCGHPPGSGAARGAGSRLLPLQISTPVGTPANWWLAIFGPQS